MSQITRKAPGCGEPGGSVSFSRVNALIIELRIAYAENPHDALVNTCSR